MRSDSSSDIRSDSPHGSESEGKQQDDFEGLFSVQHAGRDDVHGISDINWIRNHLC